MATTKHGTATKKKKNRNRTGLRRGPLSNLEKHNIEIWTGVKDDNEMARLLQRGVEQVIQYKKQFLINAPKLTVQRNEAEELRNELHTSNSWISIQKQFTSEELLFFENDYVEYRKQFKDMTATELKQMYALITVDIMIQRHNMDRIKQQNDIERLERELRKLYNQKDGSGFLQPEEEQFLMHLETQLAGARAGAVSRTKEFKDLLDKSQSIMKDLKGTRDQRIKSIEDRGKFIQILQRLEMEEQRKSIGEIAGLMDFAVEKEKHRLSQPYQFADGMIDQPLLTAETLIEENEDE